MFNNVYFRKINSPMDSFPEEFLIYFFFLSTPSPQSNGIINTLYIKKKATIP